MCTTEQGGRLSYAVLVSKEQSQAVITQEEAVVDTFYTQSKSTQD